MPGYLTKLSDWDLLDVAEGLRFPTSIEVELSKRLRQKLEREREQIFNQQRKETQDD